MRNCIKSQLISIDYMIKLQRRFLAEKIKDAGGFNARILSAIEELENNLFSMITESFRVVGISLHTDKVRTVDKERFLSSQVGTERKCHLLFRQQHNFKGT